MMCAIFLRSEKGVAHGRLYRASERVFEFLRHTYERTLGWALRHSRLMLFLTLLTLATNILLFIYIPKGFFPEQDIGRLTGTIQASQDISFQAMREKLTASRGRHQDRPGRGRCRGLQRRPRRRRSPPPIRRACSFL